MESDLQFLARRRNLLLDHYEYSVCYSSFEIKLQLIFLKLTVVI
uniref:Uncharacterized protein n=1 Tax=Arundo donax TaxID=35708 RepID=A0A0A9ANP2_ARUDO